MSKESTSIQQADRTPEKTVPRPALATVPVAPSEAITEVHGLNEAINRAAGSPSYVSDASDAEPTMQEEPDMQDDTASVLGAIIPQSQIAARKSKAGRKPKLTRPWEDESLPATKARLQLLLDQEDKERLAFLVQETPFNAQQLLRTYVIEALRRDAEEIFRKKSPEADPPKT